MASSHTIQLDGDVPGDFRREEAIGSGALVPGYLVEKFVSGDGAVRAHSVEGGRGLVMVAIEDALQGKTLMDAYADGDKVQYNIQRPGTRFLGVLKVGETVLIGDELISAGDGTLIKASSASSGTTIQKVMAIAEEDLDLTVSDATDNYLICRAC